MISDDPRTIQLTFNPNGLGNHTKSYGIDEMVNICVNCGAEEMLTRHHIVPISYRRYMPLSIKSHNFHDVLPLCIDCHSIYERKADILKIELAKLYDSPINGILIRDKEKLKYSKMALILLDNDSTVPKKRIKYIKKEIRDKFGLTRITKSKLIDISNVKSIIEKKTHGEMVMNKINDFQEFIEMWRKHFINNNECKFLPRNWDINYK